MIKSILTSAFSLIVCFTYAQRDTVKLREMEKTSNVIVTDRAPQAVYFQILGPSPIFSVNYDRRFGKQVNGAGFCAGVGYFGELGISMFSIPVSLNYLIGRSNSFIEFAGGGTYVTAQTSLFSDNQSASGMLYHLSAGYRHQPTKGGFFFRGGVYVLFAQGESLTLPYLGFGHNF